MLAVAHDAQACGGFACNQQLPVLQNAEQIVFSLDGKTVEMHVEITYEGNADEFAWIVPVPADPELFVTTAALFDRLELATAPVFTLQTVEEGLCREAIGFGSVEYGISFNSAPKLMTGTAESGVYLAAQENVGPYETVTLQATSVEALLSWLDDHDYDLPDGSQQAIAPYVAPEGAWFVALRLQKDKDTGDLAPLGLRYPGTKATIPVQLTSVSAVPDMRMQVYVFGDTRAVPESYLHVQINEAAVDWWNFGQNYFDVIPEAADQAGGHAFATDSYGSSDIAGEFFDEGDFDEGSVRATGNPRTWMERALPAMEAVPPELVAVVVDQLGLGEDDAQTFVQCPSCVDGAHFVNGVDAATDDLMERVIEPLRAAQALVDGFPRLSRMTSSLDAVEMTVDPVFVLNPDMREPDVSNLHTADQVFECANGKVRERANRRLVLANGLEIRLPSQRWMDRNGVTELEYIEALGEQKALIIEETGPSGRPTVLVDHTAELTALVADFNALMGCGCASTSGAPSAVGLLVLGGWVRRRRASALV